MAENGVSGKLTDIKINIECDVSETLTGLKAVQREAKEAARALKELDTVKMKRDNELNFHPIVNVTAEEAEEMIDEIRKEMQTTRIYAKNNIEKYSRTDLVNELKRRGPKEKIYHQFLPKGETLHINTKQEPGTYNALSEVLIIVD